MTPNAAINQAAQINYRFRWLHAALWGLYALVYFSWLLAPMMPDWFRYPGAWWLPDVYVNYAFEGMTGSYSLAMGDRSLDGVLGAEEDLLVGWSGPNWGFYPVVLGVLLGLAGCGRMFLSPGRDLQSRLPARRKFSIFTVIACALMWALLSVGLATGALEQLGYWNWFVADLPEAVRTGNFAPPGRTANPWATLPDPSVLPGSFLLLCAWLTWIGLLWLLRKRTQRYWQFERMTLWLMIPAMILLFTPWLMSVLEVQSSTWWGRKAPDGRYTTRVFAATVLLWAWACRVRLLFQLERYRLEAIDNPEQICYACGYDLRGTIAAERNQCPECGAAVTVLDHGNEAASV